MKAKLALSIALICIYSFSSAEPKKLNCEVGPITKTFGGSNWLVYSCGDLQSLIFVTAPGSPAMPFVFIYADGKFQGEGNGKKEFTDSAYAELSQLSESQIKQLIEETKNGEN